MGICCLLLNLIVFILTSVLSVLIGLVLLLLLADAMNLIMILITTIIEEKNRKKIYMITIKTIIKRNEEIKYDFVLDIAINMIIIIITIK